jgi:hypothetical protein
MKELEDLILGVHKNSWKEVKILLSNKNITYTTYLVIHAGQPFLDDSDLGDFGSQALIENNMHRCIREVVPMFGHNDYENIEEFITKLNIDQEELKLKIEEHLLLNV